MNPKPIKKKIIFIIDVLGIGGAERLMVPIIANLTQAYDIRVCVFQVKDGNPMAKEILSLGVPVDFLPIRHLRDLTAIPRLVKYLRQHKPTLIHTQLEFSDILGNIAARKLEIPTITTFHIMPTTAKRIKQRMHQILWWTILRVFCNRIISVSEESRNHYISITGTHPEKVITIYNGIDFSAFNPISRERQEFLRRQLKLSKDTLLLLTVAVLRPQKGIQYMIRALPEIVSTYPNLRYLVIGSGPYLDDLENEVKMLNLEEFVVFTGMRDDIPDLLSISDIFVLPTLTEALPTVLAEAMAANLPIIASAVGGVPEMVEDRINGLLTAPGDPHQLALASKELLGSEEMQAEMGMRGFEIAVNKFNIQTQIKHLISIYDELIGNHG